LPLAFHSVLRVFLTPFKDDGDKVMLMTMIMTILIMKRRAVATSLFTQIDIEELNWRT